MARPLKGPTHHGTIDFDLSDSIGSQKVITTVGSSFTSRDRRHSSDDDTGPNKMNLAEGADWIQIEDETKDFSTDTESGSDQEIAKKPPRMSERRKAQDVAFSSWLVD